jgi:DNA-binding NtrC family response regulator
MSAASPIASLAARPFAGSDVAGPVLILCCETTEAHRLAADVQAAGWSFRLASTVEAALQTLSQTPCEVCLVGSLADGETAGGFANDVRQRGCPTRIICVLPEPGADAPSLLPPAADVDLLPQPYSADVFSVLLGTAAQRARLQSENRRLKRQLQNRNLRDMVGQSPAMNQLRQQVHQVAELTGNVLLVGETGSGIDLVAQALHDAGRRAHRPFVKLDCSVLSAEALEAELFGEVEVTGPGRSVRHAGRFELADGGTLLFDNAHQIALPMQRRLVQVLRDGAFQHPITGERVRIDLRVILGTSSDLEQLVGRGLFREDLLELVATCRVDLPALRDRKEDIGLLAEHFLRKVAAREGKPARSLTLDALKVLQGHHWPGNVRELQNVIEQACGTDWGTRLNASLVESWIAREETAEDVDSLPGLTLREMERKLIEATFTRFAGNREKTAKALQIGIRTLCGKLREYGYPPRGGPGSNLKAWTPVVASYGDEPGVEARAA